MAIRYGSITDILNRWKDIGVFSYVLPFLLIFAVLFAVIQKSKIFATGTNKDEHNVWIEVIIAAAVGLLALQFDLVSTFFATIFPRFGIGLAILLIGVVVLEFVSGSNDNGKNSKWVGWLVAIGVILWGWTTWDDWYGSGGSWGVGEFFMEYLPELIIVGILVAVAVLAATSGKDKKAKAPEPH